MNDESGKKPNRDATGYQPHQFQHCQARTGAVAGDDQGDGKLQSEQSTGIVDQAFAFQYVDNPAGKAEAFGDRGGGDGVGG